MRPLGVELVDEGVEAFLLLDGVAGGWPGGMLLQGEVHALVSTVLLGVSGFDALEPQAEAEPPAGELGQIEEAVGACKGQAVVGADGVRQSALLEDALEGGDDGLFAGRFEDTSWRNRSAIAAPSS